MGKRARSQSVHATECDSLETEHDCSPATSETEEHVGIAMSDAATEHLAGLTTLDSVIAVFAEDTTGDGLCQAARTLHTGTQGGIRKLCRKWNVQQHERIESGGRRKRSVEELKDELTAKVLDRANALHLSTLDSAIAAFAGPDGGIRDAARTLQTGTQREIRDLCGQWGVRVNDPLGSGKCCLLYTSPSPRDS